MEARDLFLLDISALVKVESMVPEQKVASAKKLGKWLENKLKNQFMEYVSIKLY